jgi:hypothetical protein
MEALMAKAQTAPGPIVGDPPSLEWLAVGRLQIEPAYQRATDGHKSQRIITGMVKEWNWALCQPLVASRRPDGSIFVIDGQHRLEGAKKRGDIPHLPCTVLPALDHAGEAAAFVALNTKRQALSQVDVFTGMLAAGDPDALALEKLLTETGWTLARHTNTANYKAGDIACAPMLARAAKSLGEAPVRNALTTLREAFPERPVRKAARLLQALMLLFSDQTYLRRVDPDALIEAIGSVDDPADWIAEGAEVQRRNPAISTREGITEAMVQAAQDWAQAA